jgi:hypothetical protein
VCPAQPAIEAQGLEAEDPQGVRRGAGPDVEALDAERGGARRRVGVGTGIEDDRDDHTDDERGAEQRDRLASGEAPEATGHHSRDSADGAPGSIRGLDRGIRGVG